MTTSLLDIFFKLVQCFILYFQSHFVMLSFCGHSEHNTQTTYFHALIFKTIKFKKRERLKNIWIKKLESDIFSIPLTLASSETEGKMNFLNQNSNYVIKNCYMFDLNDFEFELREFNCTSKFLV